MDFTAPDGKAMAFGVICCAFEDSIVKTKIKLSSCLRFMIDYY